MPRAATGGCNAHALVAVRLPRTPAGKPRFIIYFSFDDETVTLEYIHRHELDDRDD